MGNNWRDYLKEARRYLRPLGQLEIWTPLKQSIDDKLCEALNEANFQIILNEKDGNGDISDAPVSLLKPLLKIIFLINKE